MIGERGAPVATFVKPSMRGFGRLLGRNRFIPCLPVRT
jgi:hypothetical protein